jgi:serine/threonine protein kinase
MVEIFGEIRYTQTGIIGSGEGMNSTVYRGFDPYLERDIAVKVVSKRKFGNDFASYCNEARAMSAAAHPNIVQLEYVCETDDDFHLALPLFENGSLKNSIKTHPLRVKDSLKIAQQVLAGLGIIHASEFLHLDLKPSNIFFDNDDRPLIGDFGQSRKMSNMGTVSYPPTYNWTMAPETVGHHVATRESDIYQMGTLLYRAVNGESVYKLQKSAVPNDAELERLILKGRFPDARFFLPHVPKRLRSLIRKAMRVKPGERFHSASEFAAALGRVNPSLDWKTKNLGDGAYQWTATRPGKCDFDVFLKNGSSGWETEVWTKNGHERRRRGEKEFWHSGLNYSDAIKHLTAVFSDLSS